MGKVTARTLKGFRDALPEAELPRRALLERVARVFEAHGFGPLSTPAMEYAEVLTGKYGDEGDKLLYRFRDNGDRDVALRYDLTVPLARVMAQHRGLALPFKRYQIAPVWRAEKPARGRFREFLQCDVDIVGEPSVRADAECVMVGLDVLAALDVPGPVVRVNNRRILDGALEYAGVQRDEHASSLRVIDKLPKVGRDAVVAELASGVGLAADAIERLLSILERPPVAASQAPALLDELETLLVATEAGPRGLQELRELLGIIEAGGFAAAVEVDLSIARGLDYYTSTIYETFVTGREAFGSVMSGGRYDTLLGMFLKHPLPAVGISLGVDRLFSVLDDMGLMPPGGPPAEVFLPLLSAEDFGPLSKLAAELRGAGLKVDVALQPRKLGKQLQAAQKRGYRWVVFAGEDERAAGEVTVRDLAAGSQQRVPREGAPVWLAERVRG